MDRVNVAKAAVESALQQTDMKLAASLRDKDAVEMEKATLANDLRMARLDKRQIEQQQVRIYIFVESLYYLIYRTFVAIYCTYQKTAGYEIYYRKL